LAHPVDGFASWSASTPWCADPFVTSLLLTGQFHDPTVSHTITLADANRVANEMVLYPLVLANYVFVGAQRLQRVDHCGRRDRCRVRYPCCQQRARHSRCRSIAIEQRRNRQGASRRQDLMRSLP
jgi:hypothetical protein